MLDFIWIPILFTVLTVYIYRLRGISAAGVAMWYFVLTMGIFVSNEKYELGQLYARAEFLAKSFSKAERDHAQNLALLASQQARMSQRLERDILSQVQTKEPAALAAAIREVVQSAPQLSDTERMKAVMQEVEYSANRQKAAQLELERMPESYRQASRLHAAFYWAVEDALGIEHKTPRSLPVWLAPSGISVGSPAVAPKAVAPASTNTNTNP